MSINDPRHLAALWGRSRGNGESVRAGDPPNKQQSPAEGSDVIEIHPPVSSRVRAVAGERWRGPRAEPELNSASSPQQVATPRKCAQIRRTGGAKVEKNNNKGGWGARTRPHCVVNVKRRSQIKVVKLIVPPSAVTSLPGGGRCALKGCSPTSAAFVDAHKSVFFFFFWSAELFLCSSRTRFTIATVSPSRTHSGYTAGSPAL